MEDRPARTQKGPTASEENGKSPGGKTAPQTSPRRKRKTVAEDLKKNLEEQRQLAQDNYEKFLRAYAELENYKKRVEKDRTDNLKYANEGVIRDLLPFLDNLQRALEHGSPNEDDSPEALSEGVELTLKELMRVLEKYGLTPIESVGKPFDPNLHEAMMQVESKDHDPQTAVEECEKRYLIKDRLLRPARVSVAMKSDSEGD